MKRLCADFLNKAYSNNTQGIPDSRYPLEHAVSSRGGKFLL